MTKFYGIALLLLVCAVSLDANAQETSSGGTSNCLVQDAARAAVQKQIALIDAAKVNPAEFFTGANSCISPDLMRQFDLSNLIPDLTGMLTGGATDMLTNMLNNAKQKVCDALNSQLQNVVGRINSNMMSFQSGLSGQLSGLLNGNVSNVTIPNIPNIGTFRLSSLSSGAISPVALPQPIVQTYSASPSAIAPAPQSQATESAPASAFGNIYK